MNGPPFLSHGPANPAELDWFEYRRPAAELDSDAVSDLQEALHVLGGHDMKPGQRVGVAVGSRGISRVSEVVAVVVKYLTGLGLDPVVIPAMGSHGGATAEGQVRVLHEQGVSESQLGAPVEPSMEVEQVGTLRSGHPVFTAKAALACDHLVLVNRVKPHTEFRAPVESGLTKMLTIGLGKERGASSLHRAGFDNFHQVLPEAAALVSHALHVAFGVALIEDSWHRLCRAEIVLGDGMLEQEAALLEEAWRHFARFPFSGVDLLVLRDMGKTVSGTGMDPNVTGRFAGRNLGGAMTTERLVVLDLLGASHGNAIGIGLADIVTERLRSKVDWGVTYANVIASKALGNAKLPVVVENDFAAMALGLASLTGEHSQGPRVVAAHNTLEINHLVASTALRSHLEEGGFSFVGGPWRAQFQADGQLLRIGGLSFFEPRP